ncbi:zinc finger protein 251-like isoform X2 [Anneissia japonica]|nr:zinc finger protein 251-like isoform X2 [Anneissia japonica]
MPRAFLVKNRHGRQENDVLFKYPSPLGTKLLFPLYVAEPFPRSSERSTVDDKHSTDTSESSLAPKEHTTAGDVLKITSCVKIENDHKDMPLDLSGHRSEPILPGDLPSAFKPVQRLFIRHDSDAVARSPMRHAHHLREFFDLPPRDVINKSLPHSSTVTSHELTFISKKKVLSYEEKLPVFCKSPMKQRIEDYVPQLRQYVPYKIPIPLPYAMNHSSAFKTHLESEKHLYKSYNTIPIAERMSSNETPFLVSDSDNQNIPIVSPIPEHSKRFDNRLPMPSIVSPSELVGGQLHKEFLKQHLVSIRGSMYFGHQGHKRQARAPVPGLEYIQNGNDTKLRDMIESECNETGSEESEGSIKTECQVTPQDAEGAVVGNTLTANDEDATDNKTQQLKKYMCDVCGKGFSRSNTLVTHKRIHTGDKPFKCEMCGRAFRQPGNLTRHRLTHTTVKPYVCSQCGKAFNRASNLHTHMRTHTNYKPFVCQYCGKGFHQKIDMKIHSYTHTGEKPHKCKRCGRGFKQLTHLTYHMRTHSDVKMYTCAYCGKGFNQKGNLQAHIYGHTGERPYKCEICGKGFTLASTLNTHRRTHADRKPFLCQYCGKDFYQKNALKAHVVASHPLTAGSECNL